MTHRSMGTRSWVACILVSLVLCAASAVPLAAQRAGTLVRARHGIVVSASDEATRAGVAVLRGGGNAVDAAVAVAFALAVAYPPAGNIGGGAYILVRMADGRAAVIDARETAPGAATPDMYLDASGEPIPEASLAGPRAAGVPGSVDGLLSALERFGRLPRARVLAPAIALARDGFRLPAPLARLLRDERAAFAVFPASLRAFTRDGRVYRAGERWRQPDLAATIARIARDGRDGFYTGPTAERIVAAMREGNGLITLADLKNYTSIVREPLRGTYRDCEVLTVPPSSAGGIALLEMLNMLEGDTLDGRGRPVAGVVHLLAESMKRAFADRARYLGDPAFVRIPVNYLISKEYARERRAAFRARATPAADIAPGSVPGREGDNTTHLSVIDRWGNAVSMTTTLNSVCGAKCVVDGAGFLLNNEMDDFSVKPGAPNQFGLTGGRANAIAPGKRMLSSMTPTIVVRDGVPALVLGSPGGSRIITTVLQVVINVLDRHMNLRDAVAAGRVHHQWLPDTLDVEPGALADGECDALRAMGYRIRTSTPIGRVDAAIYDRTRRLYEGCSDPRGHGTARGY